MQTSFLGGAGQFLTNLQLHARKGLWQLVKEIFLLSMCITTCSRVELYLTTISMAFMLQYAAGQYTEFSIPGIHFLIM
jgi:hypothetical protein